jgi:D-glycero-alpha-D-manno-heptose-7-phosphate kinase
MIISRTPLRITICGGGTDLPSFYSKHEGFVVSLAINKYIYITYKPDDFEKKIKLRYSQIEICDQVNQIKNYRAREVLSLHKIKNCEINICSDLPSNTGLGSSGSFLVGLSNTIRTFKKLNSESLILAEEACEIEIEKLQEPVGKQDQYIASFGGLKILEINKNGKINVKNVKICDDNLKLFLSHIHLYYTNTRRDASEILIDQKQLNGNSEETLKFIKDQAHKALELLESGKFTEYGLMLDEYWKLKKQLSKKISTSVIDEIYDQVKNKFGVLGGKIVGAGGGGFLLLFTNKKHTELKNFMNSKGYQKLEFDIDKFGSVILGNFSI